MYIIKHKKIFVALSGFLVAASVALIAFFGLPPGIEFTGGSQLDITYRASVPDPVALETELVAAGFGTPRIQLNGERGLSIRTRELSEPERALLTTLATDHGAHVAEEVTYVSIGPSIGRELARKAALALVLVAGAIIAFVAYAFRKVSEPVASWKYGVIAVITLLHDVILASGAYALMVRFGNAEVNSLLVVALLTILGLSVSDTIVVFDRIRENLRQNQELKQEESFESVVGKSLSQTLVRSINTSLTVILSLAALAIFGPDSTRHFAMVLAAGMLFGSYSSIFLASPLLVFAGSARRKK